MPIQNQTDVNQGNENRYKPDYVFLFQNNSDDVFKKIEKNEYSLIISAKVLKLIILFITPQK